MFDYNDPNDYLDVSNHEVDRQDDLEYEVRALPVHADADSHQAWKHQPAVGPVG